MSDYIYLAHHGVKGQKWYHRLYQNEDGSLTPLGRLHYGVGQAKDAVVTKAKDVGGAVADKAHSVKRGGISGAVSAVEIGASKVKMKAKGAAAESRKAEESRKAAQLQSKFKEQQGKAKPETEKEEIRRLAEEAKTSEQIIAAGKKMSDIELGARGMALNAAKLASPVVRKGALFAKALHAVNIDTSDIPGKIENAKLEAARRKAERLKSQVERIQLEADNKYAEKQMKKVQQDAERDAAKRYSRSTIRDLSDQELDDRIDRLRREATLATLEADRMTPPAVKQIRDALVGAGGQAVRTVATNALTDLGNKMISKVAESNGEVSVKKLTELMRDDFTFKKLQDEIADYDTDRAKKEANRDQDKEDEELKRRASRASNEQTILNYERAKARSESAEDVAKRQAAARLERKDLEDRAARYRGTKGSDGKYPHTYEEVAKFLGVTVDEAKKLLYE